jgi:hypothetical protein
MTDSAKRGDKIGVSESFQQGNHSSRVLLVSLQPTSVSSIAFLPYQQLSSRKAYFNDSEGETLLAHEHFSASLHSFNNGITLADDSRM